MSIELMHNDGAIVNFEKQTDVSENLAAKRPRLDTTQCQECHQMASKYNCPKCGTRTCSLECCREHKENNKCDGVRPKWTPVPYNSSASYNGKHVAQDKHFIYSIKHALNNLSHLSLPQSIVNCLSGKSLGELSDGEERAESPDDLDQLLSAAVDADENSSEKSEVAKERCNLTHMERILLSNATSRRIWLTVKDKESSGDSHYDINADTIFWTITLKFIRNLSGDTKSIQEEPAGSVLVNPSVEDGEAIDDGEILADELEDRVLSIAEGQVNEDEEMPLEATEASKTVKESVYTVKNIPETLTVSTLLRQFLKPKENGPLISKADLQMDDMQAFLEAGADGLLLYMKVPCGEKERYYIVDPSKSVLDNLRNRFVAGHPVLLVTISNEFEEFVVLSETEAQELHENRRLESRLHNRPRNFPNNQRGMNNRGGRRGWNRNARGGQNGPRNQHNYSGQPKSQAQGHGSPIVAHGEGIQQHSADLSNVVGAGTAAEGGQFRYGPSQNFRRGSFCGGNQPHLQRRNNFGGRGGGNQWQQNPGNRGNFNGRSFSRRDDNVGRKRFYNDLDNVEESFDSSASNQQRHWGTNQAAAFRSPSKQINSEQQPTVPSTSQQPKGKEVCGKKNYLQILGSEYGSP